ncbi:MAG TPA: hypothetical protein RMH99_32425 [Sandaracinaceae bacterium LLY-WYZ-13_1]|nr:hypothetical protein [Sandaracinaceae bacterium LLY-WYZ-13_1]
MDRLRDLGFPLLVLLGSALGIFLEHGPLLRHGLELYVGPIPAVWVFYLGVGIGLAWAVAELKNPSTPPREPPG